MCKQKLQLQQKSLAQLFFKKKYFFSFFFHIGGVGDLEAHAGVHDVFPYLAAQPWAAARYLQLSVVPYGLALLCMFPRTALYVSSYGYA